MSRYLEALAALPEAARMDAIAKVVEGYRGILGSSEVVEAALPEGLRAVPVRAVSQVGEIVGLAVAETFGGDGGVDRPHVVVYVPCSGSSFVCPMETVSPADAEQAGRILAEMDMAMRVRRAEPTARQAGRTAKGRAADERVAPMLEEARRLGLTVEQAGGYHKVTGPVKGAAVYLAVRGNRVDLSGFSVEHPAVRQVSEEEARERKLGRVRGQVLDFEADYRGAWTLALAELAKCP